MKVKQLNISIYFMVALVSFISIVFPFRETEAAGGQVNTGGKVLFYEEESTSNSTKDTRISDTILDEVKSSNSSNPTGRVPKLGEQVKNYMLFGVGVLLLFCLLFIWKDRKGRQ